LKQGEALSPLLFIASVYTMSRLQEKHEGLTLNGTHHILAYADDVNIVGENIDTVKKHRSFIRC
jgi:hypothetical protein